MGIVMATAGQKIARNRDFSVGTDADVESVPWRIGRVKGKFRLFSENWGMLFWKRSISGTEGVVMSS